MLIEYRADHIKLAVIGDPVAHSLSPVLQNTLIRKLGLGYVYLAQRIAPYQLADWISAATLLEFGGFNATMPHKASLLPFMDTLSDDARLFGAVNTVVIRNRECHGHNTDGEGFCRSLAEAGVLPGGRRIVVLGAGGAARSIVLKLARLDPASITLCCRRPEQGEPLRALSQDKVKVAAWTAEGLKNELAGCDLLINCTPLGMHGVRDRFEHLEMLDVLPPEAVLYDTIYNPARTDLLAAAEKRGLKAINGLGMLIHQGILALELFTDTRIDPVSVLRPVRQALAEAMGHLPEPA